MLVAMIALGLRLGGHALIDPDEGRNAVIGARMAATGDWVVPELNGLPYLDKPPLFFAAEAISQRLFGSSELAVRMPALLAAWATVLLTAWFGARLFGSQAAWVAGTACASAPLFLGLARIALFDSSLCFFLTSALVAFHQAVESAGSEGGLRGEGARAASRRWGVLAWAAMALGVLTKGPIALALPLLVAAPYAAWRRRARSLWQPIGIVSFVVLVMPWLLLVERREPGFLRYVLVVEIWQRLTGDELGRSEPFWYFAPFVLGGVFPWVVAAAVAALDRWRRARREEGATISRFRRPPGSEGTSTALMRGERARGALVFVLLWIVVPLCFLSLSQSKRPHYLLPLVPAFALLTAWAWENVRSWPRAARASAAALALAGLVLLATGLWDREWAADPPSVAIAKEVALALGAVTLGAGALAWIAAARRVLSVAALSLPILAAPVITAPLMTEVARVRSGKELAGVLRPRVEDGARLLGIETYSPTLAFYLGRPLEVSSQAGAALRSNYVVASYQALVERPVSTLHREGWWREVLRSCTAANDTAPNDTAPKDMAHDTGAIDTVPTIFVLETRDRDERAVLEAAGLPVVFDGLLLDALGPCTSRSSRAAPATPEDGAATAGLAAGEGIDG